MDSGLLSPFCFYEWAKTRLQFDFDQSVLFIGHPIKECRSTVDCDTL